jgi:hypothetical protein
MVQKRDDKFVSANERLRVRRHYRLERFEESLVLALEGPMVKLDMVEIRKKGLLAVLRGITRSNV